MTRQERTELRPAKLDGLRRLYGENTYQCPRCGYPLLLIAEHAFSELYECKQCGYTKQVKQ